MFDFFDNNDNQEYDYKRLRKDLENEYFCQGVGFSGGFGMLQMMDVNAASEKDLLKAAKREGFDLRKYRKKR